MTSLATITLPDRADKLSALRPIRPARKLFHEIAERIAAEIIGAKLPPGARLPTEQQMANAMGVSRTVVREPVAAPRPDALVTTPQCHANRAKASAFIWK